MTEAIQEEEIQEQPRGASIVDQANLAAARIEEANRRMEENIARMEMLQAKEILGGKAEAGKPQEKPKEETPVEFARRIMGGQ